MYDDEPVGQYTKEEVAARPEFQVTDATEPRERLPYGLRDAVPADAPAAWGARLIVAQDGFVDFVYDRQGLIGEGRLALVALMENELPLEALTARIGDLLRSGEMNTREGREHVVYKSRKLEVRANTNASAGYCYVAAWPTQKES